MTRGILRMFLCAEALFTLGYFLLPPSGLKAASYAALGLSAVAALVIGVRRYRPRQPLAWFLLAAGLFMLAAGDTINYSYEWVFLTEAPFPSSADVVYLTCFLLLAAGLLLLVRERTPGRDRTSLTRRHHHRDRRGPALVDLLDRSVCSRARSDAAAAAGLDRLSGDGHRAAAVAVRLWRAGSQATAAFRLLTASLLILLVADTVYGLSQLTVGWVPGGAIDLGWVLFFLSMGAAALHPSMRSLSEPAAVPTPRLSWQRRTLLTAATLMAPAMLVTRPPAISRSTSGSTPPERWCCSFC